MRTRTISVWGLTALLGTTALLIGFTELGQCAAVVCRKA